MRNKLITLLLTLCIISSFLTVSAEDSMVVSYNAKTSEVVLSGKTNERIVVAVIVKNGVAFTSLSDSNLPVYFEAIESSGGSFSATLGMPKDADSGRYTVYLSVKGENILEDSFVFINNHLAQPVINEISANPNKFIEIIEANEDVLGIDTEDTFWKNNKSDILRLLNVIKTEYTSPSQLYNDIYKAYALIYVGGKDKDEVLQTFKKYESQLGIDYAKFFEEDTRISDKALKTLCALISKENFTSSLKTRSLREALDNLKVLAAVKAADDAIMLRKVIEEDFARVFSAMISSDKNYEKIPEKNIHKVYTKIILKEFSEFEDIEKAFKASTEAVAALSPDSSPDSSSGGGFAATIPHVKEENTPSSEGNSVTTPSNNTASTPSTPVNNGSFSDVQGASWEYKAVSTLQQKGIINGYNDGTFKPTNNVTRAEFAKMAYNAFSDKFETVEKISGRKTKVALLGDSLTQGCAKKDGTYTTDVAYSDYLKEILGDDYAVENFGKSAHGILKEHKYPYLTTPEYTASLEFVPDIIVSMFGTNDIKTDYWDNAKATYGERYKYFINQYKEINPNVQVIAVIPPPFYVDDPLRPIENLQEGIKIIKETANTEGYITVDLYSAFANGQSYFPDQLHFSDEGAKKAASIISHALSNKADITFSDISNQWYAPYVNSAASAGIIKGSNGKFNPDAYIKREDAAVIIYNIFKLCGITDASLPAYTDKTDISIYAYTSVGSLGKLKVMVGANDYFRPAAPITRAESAQLIYNALNHLNSLN